MTLPAQPAASAAPRSLNATMLSGVFWIALDAVASRGMFLVAMLIAARSLGATNFGQLSAVQATIALLSAFIADALRVTAARHIAAALDRGSHERGKVIGLVILTTALAATVVSCIMLLAAPWLARSVLAAPELARALRIGALVLLMEAAGGVQIGILTGLKAFRSVAVAGIITGVAIVPAVGLGATYGSVSGVLQSLAVVAALGLLTRGVLIVRILRQEGIRPRFRASREGLAILWRFSLPAVLNSLTWAPVSWLGVTMLVNTPGGYQQMGIVGAANHWFAVLLFLPNVIANVMLPTFSEAARAESSQLLTTAFRSGIRANLLLVVPAAVAIALASPLIMKLYGTGYEGGQATLVLVTIAAVAAATINLLTYLHAALDRMWSTVWAGCAWAVAYLATARVLIDAGWGARAIGMAMIAGYSVKLALQLMALRRAGGIGSARR